MWDRWQQGESLHQIARLLDQHPSCVLIFRQDHRHSGADAPSVVTSVKSGRAGRRLALMRLRH